MCSQSLEKGQILVTVNIRDDVSVMPLKVCGFALTQGEKKLRFLHCFLVEFCQAFLDPER